MNLDERPIGGGNGPKAFNGPSTATEDFSGVPVSALLSNSNWKARKEAYERIQKDPAKHKRLLLDSLKLVANEGNAMVQEAAIEALVEVLPQCDEAESGHLAEGAVSTVVEKGTTGRPKAIQVSQQFIFALVEEGHGATVFGALLSAMSHKTPKNRLAAAQTASALVADYGVQPFLLKEILKAMQPLFNDANPQVRKETVSLCCQCYRYVGANIKGFLTDLRDVQLQELQKQFESVKVGEKPPKTIKGAASASGDGKAGKASAAAVKPIGSLTGDDNGAVADQAGFELLEESPVVGRLPKKFFRVALDKEASWQDRVEYVNETLMPLLAAPRFRGKDDYHELAGMMKEYLIDPQAPLMLLGFKMIQECARGLRGDFATHARFYVAPLLDKLKDKKVSVQLHVMKTLEDLITFNCVSMDQCNDDFEQALQSKNPTQRTIVLNFLIQMVDTLGDRSRFAKLGRATTMLTRVVNDEKASIRDVAYVLLDRLIKAFGEAPFKSVLASLDDNQRHNMAAAVTRGAPTVGPRSAPAAASRPGASLAGSVASSATPFNSPAKKVARMEDRGAASAPASRVRTSSAAGPSSSSGAARRIAATNSEDDSEAGSAAAAQVARPQQRASSAVRGAAAAPGSASGRASTGSRGGVGVRGSAGGARAGTEDAISLESVLPPKMESVTMILGLLEGDSAVLDMVRSHEWARRQEGVNRILTMVQQWGPAQTSRALECLVVYIRTHPTFREPIFQVFTLICQVLQVVLAKVPTLTPAAGYAVVSGLTPRLAEPKTKPLVREVLSLVTGKLSQRFVVRHMLDAAATVKTPKLLQEVCEYAREAVRQQPDSEEAARDAVDARGALHFVKTVCADINNAGVRQEAVLLLVALRRSPHVPAAAVERCVASLSAPLPAMFERELSRLQGSTVPAIASPPRPPARSSLLAGSTAGTASLSSSMNAPGSPPSSSGLRQPRASSQNPYSGARELHPAPPLSASRASMHRRSLSDGEAAQGQPPRNSSMGGASAASRATLGRTSSSKLSPRASMQANASATPPASLRTILQEIANGKDWRDRLEGVRRATAFVAEAPRPLPAQCAASLLKALQGRFEEANKNVVVDVLRLIPAVVEAAVADECRGPLRQLTPGVLAMLGDQKAALREEARSVAFLAMDVVGLESMLPLLQRPLTSDSNACRQNALEMMVNGFERLPPDATLPRAGMQLLTPAVLVSVMDRLLDVRVVAERALGWMLGVVGEEAVLHCVHQLKPADQQSVMPAVERQIEHQRQQAQSRQPEEAMSGGAAAATVTAPVANGQRDNEESRRTTPRLATPRASTPGTPRTPRTPRTTNNGAVTPRRRSEVGTPVDPRQAAAAAAAPQRINGSAAPVPAPSTAEVRPAVVKAATVPPPRREAATAAATAPPSFPATVSVSSIRASTGSKPASAAPTASPSQPPPAKATPVASHAASIPSSASAPVPAPAAAPRADTSLLSQGNEEMYTVREILVGLRSARPDVAQAMCKDFGRHLRAGVDCGTPEVVQVMVERLYENTQSFNVDLATALVECLTTMFTTPRCASRCHTQLLFRVTGAFFDCLLSEKLSLHESVIKALNGTTLRLLEGCPTNDVFSALLSRLTTYSTAYLASGDKSDLKFIQVTVKCVMRMDFTKVSDETVILCSHEYLLQHPPSAFRNLDDLPIRTVKTLLQTATKRYGPPLLVTAERLVGPQNLVTHFIRACLELREKAAKERGHNEQQAIEESRQEQRASQSPAPTPVKERKSCSPPRAVAAASATPGKPPQRTPSRRKKRVSLHVDPLAAATAPTTASTSAEATPSSSLPASVTKQGTGRTPVKVHPRLAAAAAAGAGAGTGSSGALSTTAPASTAASSSSVSPHGASSGAQLAATVPVTIVSSSAPPANPPAGLAGEVRKDLTDIFAHIRNHVTSSNGIDELYAFIKTTPLSNYEEPFRVQFNRCSEAFRMYIKRKLERKMEEDKTRASTFQLPPVIRNLS